MPIHEQDIKLLKSQVMEDVPEGGGASTGEVIDDNVSNNIFSDVPELSRVIGDVSLRLAYLGVQTPDTDVYRGARVIIGKPNQIRLSLSQRRIDLLVDEGSKVATAYGAFGEKVLYGRRSQGVIRSTFVIDLTQGSARLSALYRKVAVKGHASAVLEAVGTGKGAAPR